MLLTALGFANGPAFAPGSVLVKFRPGLSDAQVQRELARIPDARVHRHWPTIGWRQIRVSNSADIPALVRQLNANRNVEKAEPDYIRSIHLVPNDSRYGEQYAPQITNAERAWNLNTGAPRVVVAVLDTGIDMNHPEFAGRLVHPRNVPLGNSNVVDTNGHGTHVAGSVAARGNNGAGIAGVAWNVSIMPVQVFQGISGSISDVIDGNRWAIDHGAHVINMSLGGYGRSQAEEDVVNEAVSKNIIVVAAAGNDNIDMMSYPAAFERVIAVGSTDRNDARSGFSNFGSWVDVAAPGTDILSTLPGGYGVNSGTSMASPHVAGMAALMLSYAPRGYSGLEIRRLIESTTKNVGTWLRFGRVDLWEAMRRLPQPTPTFVAPSSVAMQFGNGFGGGLNDILRRDGRTFRVNSRYATGLGTAASARVNFRTTVPIARIAAASVRLDTSSLTRGTVTVWLWNHNTRSWEGIRSAPSGPVIGTMTVEIDPRRHLSSRGEISLIVRGLAPSRISVSGPPPFTFHLDMAQLQLQTTAQ